MNFIYHDGGRAAAGYKGQANDCVIRAVAIAAELPYQRVVDMVRELAKAEPKPTFRRPHRSSMTRGVHKQVTHRLLDDLGWTWFPIMKIGSGYRIHLRADELGTGRLVVQLSRHVTAVIDGDIFDTFDPSRNGTRCVYGYWEKPPF